MALGHYLWQNDDGSFIDIDVDALPKTGRPSNVVGANLVVDMPSGRVHRSDVPNFRIEPSTGELFHSTNFRDAPAGTDGQFTIRRGSHRVDGTF